MDLYNKFQTNTHSQDRYPVKRGDFSQITDSDVKHFESILGGSSRVINRLADAEVYNIDFMGSVRGKIYIRLYI